jgi:hypothetical protein
MGEWEGLSGAMRIEESHLIARNTSSLSGNTIGSHANTNKEACACVHPSVRIAIFANFPAETVNCLKFKTNPKRSASAPE